MILADECYVGSNHRELLAAAVSGRRTPSAAIIESDSAKQIRKNYVAHFRDGRIVDLEEKPPRRHGTRMGTGTYLLSPGAARAAARAPSRRRPEHGPRDWTSWLGGLCRARRAGPAVPPRAAATSTSTRATI